MEVTIKSPCRFQLVVVRFSGCQVVVVRFALSLSGFQLQPHHYCRKVSEQARYDETLLSLSDRRTLIVVVG